MSGVLSEHFWKTSSCSGRQSDLGFATLHWCCNFSLHFTLHSLSLSLSPSTLAHSLSLSTHVRTHTHSLSRSLRCTISLSCQTVISIGEIKGFRSKIASGQPKWSSAGENALRGNSLESAERLWEALKRLMAIEPGLLEWPMVEQTWFCLGWQRLSPRQVISWLGGRGFESRLQLVFSFFFFFLWFLSFVCEESLIRSLKEVHLYLWWKSCTKLCLAWGSA